MHIETSRLMIRPFQPSDWEDVLEYSSNPAVMHFIPIGVLDEKAVKEIVSEELSDETECYAIELKSNHQVIGHIIYHPWFMKHTYEIGWIINPCYQNLGYATEATRAIFAFGFNEQKLHRIIATCQPDNPASLRVAEKIGMRREGFFKQCIFIEDGVWWDEYLYAILENEWRENDG